VVEAVGGRANRGVRRKGVQCSGLGGRVAVMGRLLWAQPNRNSVVSYLTNFSN
jgi:hypothetical protein